MKTFFLACAAFIPLQTLGEWTVPQNPDPRVILIEARSDFQAGRYEDALAKHQWFHEHALEHRLSLYGVRLSNALDDWYELSKAYSPALEKLKETRDAAGRKAIEGEKEAKQYFHEFSSINELLGEEQRTAELFVELDKKLPDVAQQTYRIAQPALVKAENYELCGKYLVPDKPYEHIVEVYEYFRELAEEEESPIQKRLSREHVESEFVESAATLITLLVLNDRKPEAEKIAKDVRSKSKHPNRDVMLDAALEGKLPASRNVEHESEKKSGIKDKQSDQSEPENGSERNGIRAGKGDGGNTVRHDCSMKPNELRSLGDAVCCESGKAGEWARNVSQRY